MRVHTHTHKHIHFSVMLIPLSSTCLPQSAIIPGPPFLFGACSVLLSLLVALFIPEHTGPGTRPGAYKKHSNGAQSHSHSPQGSGAEGKEPLLEDSSV